MRKVIKAAEASKILTDLGREFALVKTAGPGMEWFLAAFCAA